MIAFPAPVPSPATASTLCCRSSAGSMPNINGHKLYGRNYLHNETSRYSIQPATSAPTTRFPYDFHSNSSLFYGFTRPSLLDFLFNLRQDFSFT